MTNGAPQAQQDQGMAGQRPQGPAQKGLSGIGSTAKGEPTSPTDAEIEELRNKEIACKAATGILILLLKWFKLSRKSASSRTTMAWH